MILIKSLKKNYIYNLIFQVFAIISPFLTTPYISRVLGANGVGEYSYALSIATYFGILGTLGITTYAQIIISKHRDDKEKQGKIITELFYMRAFALIVCCAVYFLLAMCSQTHKEMLLVLFIYLFAQINDVSWILQSLEDFQKLVIRNIIVKLISIGFIFLFIKDMKDLYLYAFIMQGTVLLGNFLLWPDVWKYLNFQAFKNIKWSNFSYYLQKSFIYFIPTIATTVYTVLDKSMIGWITHSNLQNGFYEQAHKIEQILVVLITSLGTVTLPRMSYLNSKNDNTTMGKIVEKTILMVLCLSLPMCFGMIAVADRLVPIFLGEEFLYCIPLVKIFSFLIIIVGLDNIIGRQCLMATDHQKQFNIGVIAGAIVNVVLNILLIPRLGAIGAACASVVAELVILGIFIYYSRSYLKINIKTSLLKFLIAVTGMYFAVCYIAPFFTNVFLALFVQVIVGILVYSLILIVLKEKFLYEILDMILRKLKIGR